MRETQGFEVDLDFYNGLAARLRGREEPFKDKQHAYLYLVFGDEWKKYAPSLNGHRPGMGK